MMQSRILALILLVGVHHHCQAFLVSPGQSRRTALNAFSGSSNYMDALDRYSSYQQEQRKRRPSAYQAPAPAQPSEAAPTKAEGTTEWSSSATQLPVTEDQNMNVEKDFDLRLGVTGQPPKFKLTEEDFDSYLKMVSSEPAVKRLNDENPFAITDVPVDVIVGKWLDSMEDALLKFRRYEKGLPYKADRPTVVVLGSGWAAHSFVKMASTFDLKVIVVSPVNHFVFTPMLASAAVGTIEYRSMTEPIRETNPTIDNFVEGRAVGVDVEKRQLTIEFTNLGVQLGASGRPDHSPSGNTIELDYDYLVCSVGTSVRSSIVKGAADYCFNLKTSDDSKRLRTAIGECLENASRPDCRDFDARFERQRRVRFVLVGGGPTGVELAAELNDFLKQICRQPDGAYRSLATEYEVILVHGGDELLPQFDKGLRARALQALQQSGVEVRLNTRLEEVSESYVVLKEIDVPSEPEVLSCGLSVWAAGNEPVPFVRELLAQLPESAAGSAGRINVDRWLRCPTHTEERFGSILVLGDVACLEMIKNDPSSALPQTAQVAGQQGEFMARLLNRGYDLHQTPPKLPEKKPFDEFSKQRIWLLVRGLEEAPDFVFLNLGLLAYVGSGEALTQVQLGEVPLFNFAGKRAFALWRSVYLAKQASTRNQALIAVDWLRTGVFGRDITRL